MYLPVYINGFFLTVSLVGIILSIPKIISLLSDIFLVQIIRKVQKKTLVITGISGLIVMGILYYFIDSSLMVIIGLIIYGIGIELYYVPTYTQMIKHVPDKKESEYDAIFKSFQSLGWTLGPIVGGFILASTIPQNIFLFFILICFIGLIFTLTTTKDEPIVIRKRKTLLEFFSALHIKTKLVLFLNGVIHLWDIILWFLIPLSFIINGKPKQAGILLSALTLPYMIFRVPAGILEDRNGREKIIFPGFILIAILFYLFANTTSFPIQLIIVFGISSVGAILSSAFGGIIINSTTKDQKDTISSISSLFENASSIIGRIGAGIVVTMLSFSATYNILAIIILFIAFITKIFLHKINLTIFQSKQ